MYGIVCMDRRVEVSGRGLFSPKYTAPLEGGGRKKNKITKQNAIHLFYFQEITKRETWSPGASVAAVLELQLVKL